ncbi:polysaccharide deacetylase family protein [Rossellomorea aquimaris]|uniref:Peptidoglycan/xylan/chitin deacetylase (PgdA/CDA1 family) n=1 Tax=Rossellomorea aquimaris TaxID=189382 RepID=A0A366EB71_9BACI|nr:polysaccharide deacetylase family protein [Rossellomorea aquimaris]RBO99616.1 peptidoglycan/xylan/chitin deacetylase (PgdA/CDA1 family) [Rossellomorea aquimaris]
MNWIYITLLVVLMFSTYSVISTVYIRKRNDRITRRVNGPGAIALTFDDGPDPMYTGQLLDVLSKHGVKATFFVVGSKVEKYPELVRRMKRDGHTIGIHHYTHVSSWFLTPFQLKKQLEQSHMVIEQVTHEKPIYYRPPWGHFNVFTLWLSRGYEVVLWSHIFQDWKVKSSGDLLERMKEADHDGSIFVLHDSGTTFGADEKAPHYMIESLDAFLEDASEKQIRFTPLPNTGLKEQAVYGQ